MLPAVDYAVTARVGALFPPGPALSRAEIADVVAGLKAAAEASESPIAEVTGLAAPASEETLVIDRATWVRLNGEMARTMLREARRLSGAAEPRSRNQDARWLSGDDARGLSGAAEPRSRNLRTRAESLLTGTELGVALGVLSTRILGQYLPFLEQPHLVLVAPNVAKMERSLGVDHADFRLWVCLHEQTHRFQFTNAPWLRGYLLERLDELLEVAFDKGRSALPLDPVTGTMALLEGYAEVMMDRVGPRVVPTVGTIRERFQVKRNQRRWKLVNQTVGLDLKIAQYRDGTDFCRHVIDAVGVDGLNAVYADAENLPSVTEIKDPTRWVKRVHG